MEKKINLDDLLKRHNLVEKEKKLSLPAGYTDEFNKLVWNWGQVFYWSETYNQWVDKHQIVALRPHEKLEDAKKRENLNLCDFVFFPRQLRIRR